MKKHLRPAEGFAHIDSIWSWIERFGVIKAGLLAILGASITTWVVAIFQGLPRSVVLTLVFLVTAIVVLALIVFGLWATDEIKKKIKGFINEPLQRRVTALEKSLGPRRLQPEERTLLQESLANAPGRIRIIAIHQDDDAKRFAEDFVEVFKVAKWDVWGIDFVYESNMVFQFYGDIGLFLFTNTTGLIPYHPAQQLADLLIEKIGMNLSYFTNYEINHDCCELVIGHRGEP